MGTKLSDIISKKTLVFEDLKNKKIAIDASNALYQFLSSIRQTDGELLMDSHGNITSHLMGLFTRTSNLMQKGIFPCYVFDGKPPELKLKERERRQGLKFEAEERFAEAETEEEQLKYAKRTSRLTIEMSEEAKKLVSALGLPVIQAPSEADAQGAFMVRNKDVYAFASSDYDCLLHACPVMIPNLTLSNKRKTASGYVTINPQIIFLKDVLKELNITQEQLIVIGILTGTDYNVGGIKGIGSKKALKLVKENKNYSKIFKKLNADFDWKEIYNTFAKMKIEKKYKLEWTEPDEERVTELLVEQHDFSRERVESTLQKITGREKSQSGLNKWVR